jgi:poly(hydroxyalkanoate) depolymerase family esterase
MQEIVDECGGIALFPQQSRSAHPMGSWNWYDARHQIAEGGEPALIVGLTRLVADQHRVDRRRIYVAGMSSGGAMAVILGQAFPHVFAAVGVHSGLPHGAARDLMSALRAMNSGPPEPLGRLPGPSRQMPTIVFHGDSDRTVHPLNAVAVWMQAMPREGDCPTLAEILSTAPTAMHGGRAVSLTTHRRPQQPGHAELWIVHGGGHAWTGGNAQASYTDEAGPDASREMLRFFLSHRLAAERRSGTA